MNEEKKVTVQEIFDFMLKYIKTKEEKSYNDLADQCKKEFTSVPYQKLYDFMGQFKNTYCNKEGSPFVSRRGTDSKIYITRNQSGHFGKLEDLTKLVIDNTTIGEVVTDEKIVNLLWERCKSKYPTFGTIQDYGNAICKNTNYFEQQNITNGHVNSAVRKNNIQAIPVAAETVIQQVLSNNNNHTEQQKNLNQEVLQYLQRNGLCSVEEIAAGIKREISSVSCELSRQKNSIACHFIREKIVDNKKKYYMHSKAKQIPIDILNHIFSTTYGMLNNAGIKGKEKFEKEMDAEIFSMYSIL